MRTPVYDEQGWEVGMPICSQGPRWLDHNVCGSTTSNCTTDDAKVTCLQCLLLIKGEGK